MLTNPVIGALRGLGLEFARQRRADGWRVTTIVRSTVIGQRRRTLGAKPLALVPVLLAAPIQGRARHGAT